jgi:thiamine pyrophosphate-dependent acetolactate synthase large subunit-like protein
MARMAIFGTSRSLTGTAGKDPTKDTLELEQALTAAYAADGYTRATGDPALLVTSGREEALEAVSALPTSWGDGQRVVVVTRVPDTDMEQICEVYAPVRRGDLVELRADAGIDTAVRALEQQLAQTAPVQLLVSEAVDPEALLRALAEMETARPSRPPGAPGPEAGRVAGALQSMMRPVLLVGREGLRHIKGSDLVTLARRLCAPVLLTADASIRASAYQPMLSELEKERIPLLLNPDVAWVRTMLTCDGVLALGSPLSQADLFGLHDQTLVPRERVICVVHQENPARHLCRPGFLIRQELADFVPALVEGAERAPESGGMARRAWRNATRRRWLRKTRRLQRTVERMVARAAEHGDRSRPLDPAWVARYIEESARPRQEGEPQTVVLTEGNNTGMWLRSFRGLRPVVYPAQMASIGVALAWAPGVRFGRPRPRIWAVLGDGGSFFQTRVLRDLVRLKMPIVFFVLDDRAWGAIRMQQTFVFRGDHCGTSLPDVDYAALARLHGCEGIRAETGDELKAAVAAARRHGPEEQRPPLVIDVKVARDQIPFTGVGFALSELDYISTAMRLGMGLSLLRALLTGQLPARIVAMVLRVVFFR